MAMSSAERRKYLAVVDAFARERGLNRKEFREKLRRDIEQGLVSYPMRLTEEKMQEYRNLTDEFRQATGRRTFTVEEAVAWLEGQGRLPALTEKEKSEYLLSRMCEALLPDLPLSS